MSSNEDLLKGVLKGFDIQIIEDVLAMICMNRPGVREYIPKYLEDRDDSDKVEYICPQLKPILQSNYGNIVYQEQITSILQELAGFDTSQSDVLRKLLGKGSRLAEDEWRKVFVYGDKEKGIMGCMANNITEEAANRVYDMLVEKTRYTLNKSSVIAYLKMKKSEDD